MRMEAALPDLTWKGVFAMKDLKGPEVIPDNCCVSYACRQGFHRRAGRKGRGSQADRGGIQSGSMALPRRWPSAWPMPWARK